MTHSFIVYKLHALEQHIKNNFMEKTLLIHVSHNLIANGLPALECTEKKQHQLSVSPGQKCHLL